MSMQVGRWMVTGIALVAAGCGAAPAPESGSIAKDPTANDTPAGTESPRPAEGVLERSTLATGPTTNAACVAAAFGGDLGPGDHGARSDVAIDANGFVLHARHPTAGEPAGALTKLAPDGSQVWTKPYGSVVATDASSNVIVAGAGVSVTKLAPDGTLLWSKSLSSASDDRAASIAADAAGAIAVATESAGVFVLEANGALRSHQPFGTAVAFDATGRLVIAGGFSGTLDLGDQTLTSSGGSDAFVAVFDAQGKLVHGRVIAGGSGEQVARALSVGENGELVVAGNLQGSSTLFGESWELPEHPEQGPLPAAFIAKLDTAAEPLFARVTIGVEAGHDVTTDQSGHHWLVGSLVGDVAPFQQTFVQKLDRTGETVFEQAALPSDTTGVGASHAVVTDACDSAILALSVRVDAGSPDQPTRALLTRIAP